MTADVICLDDHRSRDLVSGEMVCRTCGDHWEGRIEVGELAATCPSCGANNSRPFHYVEPDEVWYCACGETLFFLTPEGPVCPNCGLTPEPD